MANEKTGLPVKKRSDGATSAPSRNDVTAGPADGSRRSFMGNVGLGSAAAVALAAVSLEPLIEGKKAEAEVNEQELAQPSLDTLPISTIRMYNVSAKPFTIRFANVTSAQLMWGVGGCGVEV